MYTLEKRIWNDGPAFLDFMGRDGAPPIARRHLCFGGGGGSGGGGPQAPDYSQYISAMTEIGNQGVSWAKDLFSWAKEQGVNLTDIAKTIGTKAGAAADSQQATSDRLMGDWEKTYGPLYQAQAADAERMIKDLPGTEEHYAGKFKADTAMSLDQAKQTQQRNLRAQGFSPSAVASNAIDTMAATGRAAATAAAGESGRYSAREEARNVTKGAIDTGTFLPGVATTMSGQATANRNQSLNAPLAAASTAAGLYSPSLGYYSAAMPYMKTWGDTMAKSYDQALAKYSAEQQASEGDSPWGAIGGIAGMVGGSFLGPMGGAIGSKIGSSIGSKIAATGGKIDGLGPKGRKIKFARGGMPPEQGMEPDMGMGGTGNMITPEMSPSGGETVDDVPSLLSEGEFVIPERTVDWLGEKFFQNLIMKADREQQEQTVAAPEEASPAQEQMIEAQPPMFRSEGARV